MGLCAFVISIAAGSSSYSVVAEFCGILRSSSIEQSYSIHFPASTAAMNSTSIEI